MTRWLQTYCEVMWEWSTGHVNRSRRTIAAMACWGETMVAETEIARGELELASRMRSALERVTASGERSCIPLFRRTLARALSAAQGALTLVSSLLTQPEHR